MAKTDKKQKQELLVRVRERYRRMADADRDNRTKALDDLRFVHVPGEQWDKAIRDERGDERPMYEFNKLRVTIKRIVNDMRANRPQGKVRAVEDNDKDTAEVFEGLCRNIWNVSDGDTVIDYAAEYQVGGGMGAWRVSTKYSHDTAFDQDIVIEPIKNPFCLYADPACQDVMKRDARDWCLTTKISKAEYESRWPKAELVEFDDFTPFDNEEDFADEDTVRICEYWWKEPVTRKVVMLSDGRTAYAEDVMAQADDLALRGISVIREREAQCHAIKSVICSGDAILEGPSEWAGAQFPFVMVYGEHVVLEGKTYWFGLTRFAKDAQRSYNVTRTAVTETIALAPQSKYWATPTQANGHLNQWAEAHKKLYPVQLFNPDPQNPGPPQRMPGADVPAALIAEMQIASEEIKAVTGIFDNSLGAQGNETSGRAIAARQRQGEIATFNYSDNMAKGIRRTWEILVDLIPKVYDTTRSVRILGVDGAEKYAKVNAPDEQGEVINDLSRGKYDVAVTVGPSFSTQRQEAAEAYTALGQANPLVWQAAGDLVFKAMDLPYADQIAERLKVLLPPPIQQMLESANGQTLPPEVMAKLAQADQMMQQVQQHGMLVQQAAQELEGQKAELQAEAQKVAASKATLEADYKTKVADIVSREAQFTMSQAQAGADGKGEEVKQDREALSAQVAQAVADIQSQAAQFMQQAIAVIQQINDAKQPTVVVADPPKQKVVRVKRVNGELVGTVEEVA
jgi:hypothetical protein